MMKELHTMLPAADLDRARNFYHDKLGLDPGDSRDGALVYHLLDGGVFEIYETENAGTAKHTQMGWVTEDLNAEMESMRSNGIEFEEYDLPDMKTENGVLEGKDSRSAWFRDSEGNFICVSELKR